MEEIAEEIEVEEELVVKPLLAQSDIPEDLPIARCLSPFPPLAARQVRDTTLQKCSQCSHRSSGKFCPECGASIPVASLIVAEDQIALVEPTAIVPPQKERATKEERKEIRKKNWSEWEDSFDQKAKVPLHVAPPVKKKSSPSIPSESKGESSKTPMVVPHLVLPPRSSHHAPPPPEEGIPPRKDSSKGGPRADWTEWEKSFEKGGHKPQKDVKERAQEGITSKWNDYYNWVRPRVDNIQPYSLKPPAMMRQRKSEEPSRPLRQVEDPRPRPTQTAITRDLVGWRRKEKQHIHEATNALREGVETGVPQKVGMARQEGMPSPPRDPQPQTARPYVPVRALQWANHAIDDILIRGERPRKTHLPQSFLKKVAQRKEAEAKGPRYGRDTQTK